MKVKPRKITTAFCEHCGKDIQFHLDWVGCASQTNKGIITYKELEAYCPHCYHEIYIPAVNVARKIKAYTEKVQKKILMPIASGETAKIIEKMHPSEESEQGKEILYKMFKEKEKNG